MHNTKNYYGSYSGFLRGHVHSHHEAECRDLQNPFEIAVAKELCSLQEFTPSELYIEEMLAQFANRLRFWWLRTITSTRSELRRRSLFARLLIRSLQQPKLTFTLDASHTLSLSSREGK